MVQTFYAYDEITPILPVDCRRCGKREEIGKLEVEYSLAGFGFEMRFCPTCRSEGKAVLPLVLLYICGEQQSVRGLAGEPARVMWRFGSGESHFD